MSSSSTNDKNDLHLTAALFCAANGVSVLVCFAAAAIVFRFKLHTKVVYRLALYQVLSAMTFSTTEVLEIVFVKLDVNTTITHASYTSSGCSAVGWFVVFTQWMKLLFTMWVTLHLFCFAVFYKNLKRLEVLYVVTSLLAPAAIACVPLITHSYVLSANLRCYIDHSSLPERVVLLDAPAIIILLVSSIAMAAIVVKLTRIVCWRPQYETLTEGNQFEKALKHLLPLAAYPVIFLTFMIPVVVLDIYYATPGSKPSEKVSILFSICTSLWSLTSGTILIMHIFVAKRIENKKLALRIRMRTLQDP